MRNGGHPVRRGSWNHLCITVGAVLTDNGREFCGKPENHPYELLLAVEGIKHRTTKVAYSGRSGRSFRRDLVGARSG